MTQTRKKIGIVGYKSDNHFGVGMSYMHFFSEFGDVSIINHTETEVRTDLDLLIIPGGPDVDVTRYLKKDEKVNLFTGSPCPIRERFDRDLLAKYIENKTPIFGICRGHQTLAVHFGGTLIQDMWHETNPKDNRRKKVHGVKLNVEYLNSIGINLKTKRNKTINIIDVNSIHHQVVDQIPMLAVPIANYMKTNDSFSDDEVNEALFYPELNIASVQWHPEEIHDGLSILLIKKLLKL